MAPILAALILTGLPPAAQAGDAPANITGNDTNGELTIIENKVISQEVIEFTEGDNVYGWENNGDAANGRVTIENSTVGNVIGGYADNADATGNEIIIRGASTEVQGTESSDDGGGDASTTDANVFGGYVRSDGDDAHATGNTVIIYDGTFSATDSTSIHGGRVDMREDDVVGGDDASSERRGDASSNTVEIYGGTFESATTQIRGGYTNKGHSDNNRVTIYGGTFNGTDSTTIHGGRVGPGEDGDEQIPEIGDATRNTVEILGGTFSSTETHIRGGYTYRGNSEKNCVTISGGTFNGENTYIRGGYVYDASANDHNATGNIVSISGGTFQSTEVTSIIGGYVYKGNGDATDNIVTISGGTFKGDETRIRGGYVSDAATSGDATDNSVTILGGTFSGTTNIYGGQALGKESGNATGNSVTILGGTFSGTTNIYGGYVSTETSYANVISGNTLNLSSNATFTGEATAINFETITFLGEGSYSIGVSTAGTISDGVTTTLDVGSQDVTLSGNISDTSSGSSTTLNIIKTGSGKLTLSGTNTGYTGSTTVQEGILSLASADALSGSRDSAQSQLTATLDDTTTYGSYTVNNGATLDFAFTEDGTVNNDIKGEGDVTVNAANNAVEVKFMGEYAYTGWTYVYTGNLNASAATSFSSRSLYIRGGATFTAPESVSYSPTTLIVDARNGKSVNYKGADLVMDAEEGTMHISGPAKAGSTALLLVDEAATLNGVSYSYTATGAVPLLQTGDRIHLVKASNLSADDVTGTHNVMTGTTITYDLTEEILSSAGELNLLVIGVKAAPQAKDLLEASLAGTALVNQGADMVSGSGIVAAMRAIKETDDFAWTPFAAVQGGTLRYHSGSHIDMRSMSLMAGFAAGTDTAVGDLTLGAFFEYGTGSYDTNNSFNTGSFSGDGNAYYVGWGILGRMDFLDMGMGHFYVEASGRMGGLYNSYENQDMRDYAGRDAEFDRCNAYYSFHAGLGYIFDFTETAHLDVHGKYYWTRVDGEELTLSTGETLDFDAVNSSRLRFGTRFTYDVNPKVTPYIGVAYEHEFEGIARGTTNGYDINSTSLKGDTGIGEIGITLTPEELPFSMDAAIQGYVGKREGVTGSLFFKYTF